MRLFFAERLNFFSQIDANGTPGNAPSASHATGRTKLVYPAAEFVRQPLPVARLRCRPDAPAMDVRETGREARVPGSPPLRCRSSEVGDIFDTRAETGWTNHGAIRAAQAAVADGLPMRAF